MQEELTKHMKKYWDDHPIGVEAFDEPVGSPEFYAKYLAYYDRFYDYKHATFRYEQYRGKKVLEVGCGLGIDSVKFARSGADLTCVDLSETSVRCTAGLMQQLGLKAEVLQGDVQELGFPDDHFDVVYAYGVLMYPKDENAAVEQLRRVLKPGGELLAVLYHRRSWYHLLVKLTGAKVESDSADPPLNRVYSIAEARELFKEFRDVEITLDRFPRQTRRRKGLRTFLYNWIFVPLFSIIPRPLVRRFGWHIIVKARK